MSWRDIPGFTDDHLEGFYRELVAGAPRGATIVEVGVCLGRSLMLLAHEAVVQGRDEDLVLYGVDTWADKDWGWVLREIGEPLDESRGFFENVVCCLDSAVDGMGHLEIVRLVRCESVRAARLFDAREVYATFIDGDHEYDAVRADIAAWSPKTHGILAGHDYGAFPGVTRAVNAAFPQGLDLRGSTWIHRRKS